MIPAKDALFEQLTRLFAPMECPPKPAEAAAQPAASTVVAAPAPVEPEAPCKKVSFAAKGYDLDLTVPPERILEAVGILDQHGFTIDYLSGVDWPEQIQLEVVYDFIHFGGPLHVVVRTRLPRDNPEIASISSVFSGANWHERETAEFYGIKFIGHPNLIHLILPDDMVGYPLRKDFKFHA